MSAHLQSEEELLKEILSGKYKDQWVVYDRKSTDEPNNQKNSLSYQKAENTTLAANESLPIASVTLPGFCTNGIVSEKHSAFKEGEEFEVLENGEVRFRVERPKFHRTMFFLNKGCFKGMISYCWDRASRNDADATVIRKLAARGVGFRFRDMAFDDGPMGQMMMSFMNAQAAFSSSNTGSKVKDAVRLARRQGKCTYRAPMGFLNKGTMDKKPHDPKRAKEYAQIFKMFATGEWSLLQLQRYAAEHGITTCPQRRRRTKEEILEDEERDKPRDLPKIPRPLTATQIGKMLRNPFYAGLTKGENGGYVKSTSHKGIVSVELFKQVQELLSRRNVGIHYTEKLEYPMRGFVRCADCHRVYTPYEQKGKTYFYSRCKLGCTNKHKSHSLESIEGIIANLLHVLPIPEDRLTELDQDPNADIKKIDEKRAEEATRIRKKKERIEAKQKYLSDDRLSLLQTGVYTPETFIEEQARLSNELAKLEQEAKLSDTTIREMIDEVIKLSELVKNVTGFYILLEPPYREQIARSVFSELYLSKNVLSYKLHRGFFPLTCHEKVVCGQKEWFSELETHRPHVKDSINELTEICKRFEDQRLP